MAQQLAEKFHAHVRSYGNGSSRPRDLYDMLVIAERLPVPPAAAVVDVCVTYPGFNEDLVVTAQSAALVEWHLGHIAWTEALQTQQIKVDGPPALARALPSWSTQSGWAHLNI